MSRSIDFPTTAQRRGLPSRCRSPARRHTQPEGSEVRRAAPARRGGSPAQVPADLRGLAPHPRGHRRQLSRADCGGLRGRSVPQHRIGKALKRLQNLDGITFTSGQKNAAAALDRIRNQLQHHGLISTAEAVEAQAAKARGFILDFIDAHHPPLPPGNPPHRRRPVPRRRHARHPQYSRHDHVRDDHDAGSSAGSARWRQPARRAGLRRLQGPRTTRRFDRSCDNLDRNAAYTVIAYLA